MKYCYHGEEANFHPLCNLLSAKQDAFANSGMAKNDLGLAIQQNNKVICDNACNFFEKKNMRWRDWL